MLFTLSYLCPYSLLYSVWSALAVTQYDVDTQHQHLPFVTLHYSPRLMSHRKATYIPIQSENKTEKVLMMRQYIKIKLQKSLVRKMLNQAMFRLNSPTLQAGSPSVMPHVGLDHIHAGHVAIGQAGYTCKAHAQAGHTPCHPQNEYCKVASINKCY